MTDTYDDFAEYLAIPLKTMDEARDIIRGIMPNETPQTINSVAETLLFVSNSQELTGTNPSPDHRPPPCGFKPR